MRCIANIRNICLLISNNTEIRTGTYNNKQEWAYNNAKLTVLISHFFFFTRTKLGVCS